MTGVLASAISDNMQYAATAEHRKIVLWNAKTGEPFWLWEAPADIRDMDLSNDGNQPFFLDYDNRNLSLVCNGEIYNFKYLINKFNLQVSSQCDCEILLHLYIKLGVEEMIQELDGVFSIIYHVLSNLLC